MGRTGSSCGLHCDPDWEPYFRETSETYATGLLEILRQLPFRYELGFKPATLDGKHHRLRVELSDAADNQRKEYYSNTALPMWRPAKGCAICPKCRKNGRYHK